MASLWSAWVCTLPSKLCLKLANLYMKQAALLGGLRSLAAALLANQDMEKVSLADSFTLGELSNQSMVKVILSILGKAWCYRPRTVEPGAGQ